MRNQLYVVITPETEKRLGGFLVPYAKQFLKEVVNMDMRELNKVSTEEVKTLYRRKDKRYRYIQIDREVCEKWKAIPWQLKKHAFYLIYKKLMEVEL